ncbi:hypothetical protein BVRB_1g020600 [Beta vulgaris subsp. vulgaris]|uniref:Uncharacterized protein n=1 Tax=Beta vulgaris subsp. vulgaris TaxID=3555 RepID=A0A0J8E9N6_BETVV|nr:hypothetical protein BVRB_1g020600 [Beta vulgaris subsp. vulgaris]
MMAHEALACGETGDFCDLFHPCCGAYKCNKRSIFHSGTCIRDTNSGCSTLNQACGAGKICCGRNQCSGTFSGLCVGDDTIF